MKYKQNILPLIKKTKDNITPYIASLCKKIDRENSHVHAFLPEKGRKQRLQNAAKTLPNQSRLFGISVGVKDIFNVDGLPTRAGSQLPPEEFQGKQATIVTRLQQAGALIIGKTVATEFATGGTPSETLNPVNTNYSPGGSSSGSAAAVAAGLCELAIGSQTIGSTSRPASYCGIVGFKGSYERIMFDGVVPYAPSLDTVGLFTRQVSDLISVAKIVIPTWHAAPTNRKPVLGIPVGNFLEQADKDILQVFNDTTQQLEKNEYTIKTVNLFEDIETINENLWIIAKYELAKVHQKWYTKYKDLYSPKTQELIDQGQKIPENDYQEAHSNQTLVRKTIEKVMIHQAIDVWVSPAASTYPPKISEGVTGNPVMNIPWTYAGLPSISIPIKESGSLPLGLQIVAAFGKDEMVLDAGLQIERIIN